MSGSGDLRDLNITDLLGRHQVDTDLDAIAGYLTGRRVLVTGAGGSIGSELCRQIHRFGPAELMMLDRDESALHAVQLSLHGRALLDSADVVLCDIRDAGALDADLRRAPPPGGLPRRRAQAPADARAVPGRGREDQRPRHPQRAGRGARRRRRAVRQHLHRQGRQPGSVLGYSKRIAERLTATYAALDAATTFLSVRFGNVLGSRGSVLTTFAEQIAARRAGHGHHPEVTRYFMTIQEACQLVIQAGAIGAAGRGAGARHGRAGADPRRGASS